MKDKRIKHGMYGTRIYSIWHVMKTRCNCVTDKRYKNYGGRGISIYKDWDKFNKFYEWAISNGYKEDLTLDRINNDGNYEPSNCRWATYKIQANNRRNNIVYNAFGETGTLRYFCDKYNVNYYTLRNRVKRKTLEEALTQKYKNTTKYSYNGRLLSIRAICKIENIHVDKIYGRIRHKNETLYEAINNVKRGDI